MDLKHEQSVCACEQTCVLWLKVKVSQNFASEIFSYIPNLFISQKFFIYCTIKIKTFEMCYCRELRTKVIQTYCMLSETKVWMKKRQARRRGKGGRSDDFAHELHFNKLYVCVFHCLSIKILQYNTFI